MLKHLQTGAFPDAQLIREVATPRARTLLAEREGFVTFLQEDGTCVFPYIATAWYARRDEVWYVTCKSAHGEIFVFPSLSTGQQAFTVCAWLNRMAEMLLALTTPWEKEALDA